MSLYSKPYHTVICDFPGCDASADEGSDYAAWSEEDSARVSADDAGWWRSVDGKDFCNDHPVMWQSDLDTAAQPLAPTEVHLLLDDDGLAALRNRPPGSGRGGGGHGE